MDFKTLTRCWLSGFGFLADSYNIFILSIVQVVLREVYTDPPQSQSDRSLIASASLWGAVVGQLLFGALADALGRKNIGIITLVLIMGGAIGCALAFDTAAFSVYGQLTIYLAILGIGVGGEYPLSAALSTESIPLGQRGVMLAAVFSMQGLGHVLASLVMFILLATGMPRDIAWRLGFALGAVPALVAYYFRRKNHESADFSKARANHVPQWVNMRAAMHVYWRGLLGASIAWLLFDLTYYGNGLFSGAILQLMGISSASREIALHNVYLTLLALPGYAIAILLIDRVGRKRLQYLGFFLLGVTFILLGAIFGSLSNIPTLLFFLYSFTFLFSNAGPNTTTYVIPAEYFPTEVRTTCHGIASAAGKIGAAIAAYTFPVIQDNAGIEVLMIICGVVALAGGVWTILVLPSYDPVNHERELQRKRGRYHAEVARICGLPQHAPSPDAHGASEQRDEQTDTDTDANIQPNTRAYSMGSAHASRYPGPVGLNLKAIREEADDGADTDPRRNAVRDPDSPATCSTVTHSIYEEGGDVPETTGDVHHTDAERNREMQENDASANASVTSEPQYLELVDVLTFGPASPTMHEQVDEPTHSSTC